MSIRTIRRRARLRSDRRGQAIVETALVAPILLMLILGLIDFSRAWSAHHVISDAAREASRMLVVFDANLTQADADAMIQNRLTTAGMDPARSQVIYNEGTGRGDPTTVTINYTFDFWLIAPFMKWATGDERFVLVSQITMRNE